MSSLAEAPILLGTVVGDRYHLTDVIKDRATIAARAQDEETGAEVFFKAKRLGHEDAFPDAHLRLAREADMLASLSHPQIPGLIDVGLDAETPYIVTELQPDTVDILERFKAVPDAKRAAQICLSALEPLAYVHGQGITHRDISPGNLLVAQATGLADFELALCKDADIAERVYKLAFDRSPHITDADRVKGTPDYIPPEQALAQEATPQSDLYALGAVLYHFLYGRAPFRGKTERDVAAKHCKQPIDFYRGKRGRKIPNDLLFVVARAMQKQPGDRYGSAEEMRADLIYCLSQID